ncbi:ABC transporter ATP-binding protein [Paraconexibacter antarcticus]|uniref:ABC transporter ATP-binding protein n=1 Tax=Paraconexibacter antarcticus TaxID=2949664 RepID=A0ABY5DVI2_9ACTN|nr:ABC transporter ATP-binding protein [Paraconexibacter antarcticus]UTI65077.1 ABC transporter ATP-binding protein [Paraconexibacter antarcticus]
MTALAESPADARAARLAAAPPAVVIDHASKTFRLPHVQYSTLKERLLHPWRSTTYDELRALNDVDVTIRQGEFFGIVGRNGSGKSTLLKCLAGIYRPDAGAITVHGRLSPFIELGVGFNPDLTARDNVVINAVMMGLTRREAAASFDAVIAFAELEEFVDLKLKNYSSGMAVRLGFATAIQVSADVLLVDEVLAVGDAAFQQKCFEEFNRLKAEGRTVIFVTHDMSAAERYCDRAMLIERGDVQMIGEPHAIARAYNELNFGRLVHEQDETGRYGDQKVCEIADAWFEKDGVRTGEVAQHERVTMCARIRFHEAVVDPVVGFSLRNDVGHTFFVTTSEWAEVATGSFAAGEELTARVAIEAVMSTTKYELTPSIARVGGVDVLDVREDLASLYVHGTRVTGGLVDLPHRFELERG